MKWYREGKRVGCVNTGEDERAQNHHRFPSTQALMPALWQPFYPPVLQINSFTQLLHYFASFIRHAHKSTACPKIDLFLTHLTKKSINLSSPQLYKPLFFLLNLKMPENLWIGQIFLRYFSHSECQYLLPREGLVNCPVFYNTVNQRTGLMTVRRAHPRMGDFPSL